LSLVVGGLVFGNAYFMWPVLKFYRLKSLFDNMVETCQIFVWPLPMIRITQIYKRIAYLRAMSG
jgi:hypothetical protein